MRRPSSDQALAGVLNRAGPYRRQGWESRQRGRFLPLPLAGEVAPKARVRALSSGAVSPAETPPPQPSPASGRGSAPCVRRELTRPISSGHGVTLQRLDGPHMGGLGDAREAHLLQLLIDADSDLVGP